MFHGFSGCLGCLGGTRFVWTWSSCSPCRPASLAFGPMWICSEKFTAKTATPIVDGVCNSCCRVAVLRPRWNLQHDVNEILGNRAAAIRAITPRQRTNVAWVLQASHAPRDVKCMIEFSCTLLRVDSMKRKLSVLRLTGWKVSFLNINEHTWKGPFWKGTDICKDRRAAELYVPSES